MHVWITFKDLCHTSLAHSAIRCFRNEKSITVPLPPPHSTLGSLCSTETVERHWKTLHYLHFFPLLPNADKSSLKSHKRSFPSVINPGLLFLWIKKFTCLNANHHPQAMFWSFSGEHCAGFIFWPSFLSSLWHRHAMQPWTGRIFSAEHFLLLLLLYRVKNTVNMKQCLDMLIEEINKKKYTLIT